MVELHAFCWPDSITTNCNAVHTRTFLHLSKLRKELRSSLDSFHVPSKATKQALG